MRNKYIKTLLLLSVFIVLANLFNSKISIDTYEYQSSDGGFRDGEMDLKGRDLKIVESVFESYKRKTSIDDAFLYRTFKKSVWKFWNWYEYLTHPRYNYPYKPFEPDKVSRAWMMIPKIQRKRDYEAELVCKVVRVISGDTIIVTTPEGKIENVRLIGIDAPKSQRQLSNKARREAERTGTLDTGQKATMFLKTLLRRNDKVRLEFDDEERDKFGMLLAYVYDPFTLTVIEHESLLEEWYIHNGEIFINATIIKAGYAQPITISPYLKYEKLKKVVNGFDINKSTKLFKELYQEARENKRGLWR